MISLTDLRARNVQPVWQEAVAVIQELIETVSATSSPLPDLEHIALIPNGDVVALPGSSAPKNPVRHAATMLNFLVDGVATPPELEQFLQRNVANPPQIDSLAEFARQLAFFERPGRRTDVERLVGRAAAAEQITRADEELKRLIEKANEADQSPEKETPGEQRAARKLPALIVAAALLVGALALAAFWWRGRPAPPPQQTAADPAATGATADAQHAAGTNETREGKAGQSQKPEPTLLERTTAAVRSAVAAIVGSGSAPAEAANSDAPPPATPEKARPRAHRPSQTPKIAAAPLEPDNAGDTKPATSVELLPMTEDVTAVAEADANVYTSTDAKVIPPVMVRPVLPKDPPPGVPLHQIGTIEVWVDENGDVEQVRLVSPANRYQERMLVSAAKMWKFRPAFKDGHPVRYRTRVRLTV